MLWKQTLTDSDFRVVHYIARSANPPHAHGEYVLTYEIRGVARSRIGSDRLCEFRPGDINLLNPGEVHKDFASPQGRECLMVGVRKEFLHDLFKELGRSGPNSPCFLSPKAEASPIVRQIYQSIKDEVDGRLPGREMFVHCLVTELVIQLLRQMQPCVFHTEPFNMSKMSALWQVRKAIEYLQDTVERKFELTQVAIATGLSKFYLERLFKQATGFCLHTYATYLRIDRAKQLLSETSKSLVSIALELGFSDQSHFTNVFKRFVGITPRAYRATVVQNRSKLLQADMDPE
jgi:AraC family transcriptional regulator